MTKLMIILGTLSITTTLAARPILVEAKNKDVQTLQAWRTSGPYYTGESVDLAGCDVITSAPGIDGSGDPISYETRDCTASFELLLGKPFAHAVLLSTVTRGSNGPESYHFRCAVTEIRTVTKADALYSSVFDGIGFYHNATNAKRLVPKNALVSYGDVFLKDGTKAVVHGFLSFSRCWRGTVSSSAYHKEEFKPFVEYSFVEEGEIRTYRQWEDVESNMALGQIWGYSSEGRVDSFDRQWELLRQ